jgi:hypothetical protein
LADLQNIIKKDQQSFLPPGLIALHSRPYAQNTIAAACAKNLLDATPQQPYSNTLAAQAPLPSIENSWTTASSFLY